MEKKQIHRGNYMKALIKKSDNNLNDVAYKLSISRSTLFRWLKEPKMSFLKMAKIAAFIGEDITGDFPEAEESILTERTSDFEDVEPMLLKDKYMVLLENYNRLLEEHLELKRFYGTKTGLDEQE